MGVEHRIGARMNHDHGGRGDGSYAGLVVDDVRYQWLEMPATADRLHEVREGLRQWAATVGLTDEQIETVVLCADEAMSNAIEHGYAHSTGTLDIVAMRSESPAEVSVTVTDRGEWREPPGDPGDRGRGLLIIRRLAQDVDLESGPLGTTVRMTWPRSAEPVSD
jgi:anti-sigma regulatory factor (Ser/Thr protein kinase)